MRSKTSKRRRGVTLVEFAIVVSLCLTLLFGIVEYSRIVWIKQLMDYAAADGARYAVVHTADKTTAEIQDHIRHLLSGQDLQIGATIQIYKADPTTGANIGAWTDATFGEGIAVQINGNVRMLLAKLFFHQSSIAVQSKSIQFSEAN